ncbi:MULTISPECIES: hypothetical protein [Mameliella]|uniref:hypothetical protein n=1 Tax=Mameliella TaxID=1434019 RepID=UPI000B52AA94|nr:MULTISPECIES: hypothetical protein [Mameliella]MCR9273865.1 hypothetical protein [Paracoccaceae bacterium]OWV62123.1 hypothetical protein CDZ98_06490 [Mameliella alba]
MRVLIHPGFHKTGTTSLQRGADAQRETLAPRLRLVLPHDIEPLNFAARRVSVGINANRVAAFRDAVAGFAQRVDPEDPRPLLVSSEHLCGLLPGRKSVTTYATAPELLGHMVEVLARQVPDLSLSVWFTTRAPEAWLKSLYWQLLRSQRLTVGPEQFAVGFRDAAELDAVVARVAERLGRQAEVSSTRLEACGTDPLGPLGVALDRLGVSRGGLLPLARQNVQPAEAVAELLALNQSDLDDAALGAAKTALLKRLRKAGQTRAG